MKNQKDPKFKFKQFSIQQEYCGMKVNSDSILLGSWANVNESKTIVDIGTGNGLLALMCAQKNQSAKIIAVEIDTESCKDARENFKNAPWTNRLELHQQSIQEFSKRYKYKIDHIIANPPFFSGGTLSHNQQKDTVRHTIKLSHGDLLLAIRRLLSSDGKCSMILPVIEGLRFIEIVERYNYFLTRKCIMRPKKSKPSERILFEFSPFDWAKAEEKDIIMYEEVDTSTYTEEYKEITKDFYLYL